MKMTIATSVNVFCLALLICIMLTISQESIAEEAIYNSTTNVLLLLTNQFQKIVSMPFGVLDESMKATIRNAFKGTEKDAVALALKNIHGNWNTKNEQDIKTDLASIRIMTCLQDATMEAFKQAFNSKDKPDLRVRRALVRWANAVDSCEAIGFAINMLISDTADAEDINPRMLGAPRRLCDTAYNMALERIQGAELRFGKKSLGNRDSIVKRDESLNSFRSWWNENKGFLEKSEMDRKFLVNQDAKKAGIPIDQWRNMSEEDRAKALK